MEKKRICVVTSDAPFVRGGHTIIAETLAKKLEEHGYLSYLILTPSNRFGRQFSAYLANRLTDIGITADGYKIDQVISFRYPSYAVKHPLHVCWINHRMREYYDLWPQLCSRISWKNRIKEEVRRFLIHRMDNYLLKHNVTKVYAQSETIRQRLLTWGKIPSEVLYPPPPERPYRIDGYDNFIFSVSRLYPLKRLDLLIEAFSVAKNKSLKCYIAGEGYQREELQSLITQKNLEKRITLLGSVTDQELIDYYARCKAVFFAPLQEDYGFVTLEAFRSHKAVITCKDSGGPAELVKNGETGFILEPEPVKIAHELDKLAEDESLAEKLGAQAYQFSLSFTWEKAIKKLIII
jgi:glycosyltransferase involved in cell wall biosynthesis